MPLHLLIAGFGGQGILFMGKVIAYTAMIQEKYVSWLPSYGPEMRGGTANCSVCIDDKEISCPLITEPETLVVLNRPSYERFARAVLPGGHIFLDEGLVQENAEVTARCQEENIQVHRIDAARMAEQAGLTGLTNMVMLGRLLRETGFTSLSVVEQALEQCVSASRAHLLEANLKALHLGLA